MVARAESLRATYRRWTGHWPWLLLGGLVVVALALWLWLVLGPGAAVPVSPALAPTQAPQAPALLTWRDVSRALVRSGVRPEGHYPAVDVLLATPQYYAVTGRNALYEPTGPSLVFILSEDTHERLSPVLKPTLRLDGRVVVAPAGVKVLADSPHHRMTVVHYAAASPEGRPLVTAQTGLLELFLGPSEGTISEAAVLSWELPIAYTKAYSSAQVVVGDQGSPPPSPLTTGAMDWTWAAILAMLAGMLVALSPCLVQLGAYFTATLAGVSAESSSPLARASAQRHIVYSALFFVLGFTVVYTAGGAAAGYVGQSLQSLGLFTSWVRPLSIAAGLVVLLLAVRVAWNARAPLVCRLPLIRVFGEHKRTGALGSAVMGFTFAGGCLTCFSASVLPALLLYAGSTGSMASGAALLLVFSLGISLPCLALAFGASHFQPLLQRYHRLAPALGLAGALVMAVFGVIMISNQFHVVSGLIYRLMGLS